MRRAAAGVRGNGHRPHRLPADARRRAACGDRVADPAPGDQGHPAAAHPGRVEGMRLGLVLPERREHELAWLAEEHGLFGVLAGSGNPLTAINAAVYASTATEFARVIVRLSLGLEHPVLIAEELAVLDNVNNGRT